MSLDITSQKIGIRLAVGFGVVVLLSALIGVVGVWRLHSVSQANDAMVNQTFLKQQLVSQWYNDARLNGTRLVAMIKIDNPADRRELLDRIRYTYQFDSQILARLQQLPHNVAEQALLDDITVKRDNFQDLRDRIIAALNSNDVRTANQLTDSRLDAVLNQYLAALARLTELQSTSIVEVKSAVAAQFVESRAMVGLLTALVLLFSALFAWWLSRSITAPLQRAIIVAQAVGGGDLSSRFDNERDMQGTDEVSQLMQALKRMNDSLVESLGALRISNDRIDSLAYRDSLTGLPNRQLARDRFEQAIALADRSQTAVAVMWLDLDNFKSINDALGHASGDLLLRDVAGRLANSVRASDTISRNGGDEFLIVLGGLPDEDSIATKAVSTIEQLSSPFTMNGLELSTTCSLGIAVYPSDGRDFATLIKNAEIAMYQAKEAGRNGYRFYDAKMHDNVNDHVHLLSSLRSALARNEFRLYYQPQYDLHSGAIVGAEALLRWPHPELGMISPARFIPVAENSGLIHELGRWVLGEACRQAREWQNEGLGELVMAINLSPVQFRRGDVEQDVINALRAADLSPTSLELEITESLLVADSENLTALLGRLRGMGIRLSIDDFGTGYSNLGYLKRFRLNCLKIDQSFIRRMTENGDDESIVRAIIEMAHSLKLVVVAEGVEDMATMQRLVELGCESGQGYYWSAALPPDQFRQFVMRSRAIALRATG